ncbi:MAG: Nramp family divalent metal transporter [Bacteroidales bacterium]|jgi:Mn2+/Fe2+ NRAMP family transporter|nr:Nramp family divalent metal transporter [Bacteroidales bacterium]
MKRFFQLLGPGLLYAGAAIGVSHLVQSTRAGAEFGFDLMWVLLAANLLKFPFFEIGSRYVLATNQNLIHAYKKEGSWVLWLFLALTIITMFPIVAALVIVTAGMSNSLIPSSLNAFQTSIIIMVVTMLVLIIGRYKLLDQMIKVVILVLTISTIIAVVAAFGAEREMVETALQSFDWMDKTHIIFLIAFIGWMPAPIDIVVWGSLWSQSKNEQLKQKPTIREALIEFRVGYFGTMGIAAAFLALGALIMYGTGEALSPNGAVFADQLIKLYTNNIGEWAYPFIALAAFTTMLSTTITVSDAYPRTVREAIRQLFPHSPERRLSYILWMIILMAGSLIVLSQAKSMRVLVDLANTLSFITAPILAYLNYRAITNNSIPKEFQPAPYLKIWSVFGIILLTIFTLFYIGWRIFA